MSLCHDFHHMLYGGSMEDPLPERHFLVDPQQPRLSFIGFLTAKWLWKASVLGEDASEVTTHRWIPLSWCCATCLDTSTR